MTKWESDRDWITEEERSDVLEKVKKVEKWIEDKLEEQGNLKKWEDPAFKSSQVPVQVKGLEHLVLRLSKKPKPKLPKKEKKNETDTAETEGEGEEGEENLDEAGSAKARSAEEGGEKAEEAGEKAEEGEAEGQEPKNEAEKEENDEEDEGRDEL